MTQAPSIRREEAAHLRGVAIAAMALRDLAGFTAATSPGYVLGRWHERLCTELESFMADCTAGLEPRLIIQAPPRHGKTEIIGRHMGPAYMARRPGARVLYATHTQQPHADMVSLDARRVVEERLAPYLPHMARTEGRKWTANLWETRDCGWLAVGAGVGTSGMGAHMAVVDDPFGSDEDASSPAQRSRVWRWYLADIETRLMGGGGIVVMHCMTGDTPVLMADGSTLPLRDLRPGSRVATYDNGALSWSLVMNHASQGHDKIYRITTTSGVVVHANERHPFLVEQDGERRWIKVRDLTTDHRIVAVRGSGESGRAVYAAPMAAKSQSPAEACARLTTARRSGPMDTGRHRPTRRAIAGHTSSVGTGSQPTITAQWQLTRAGCAQSAGSHQEAATRTAETESSSSTTATRRGSCGHCSATTATSPLGTPSQQPPRAPWRTISDFTTDRIASIEDAGTAEVFDIQVQGTENFIANGLVSHNTRWHEDDLAGRLQRDQPGIWRVLSWPAIAEDTEEGRAPGDALVPHLYARERLESIRSRVGERVWASLYQQRPNPEGGGMFKRTWFRNRYKGRPEDIAASADEVIISTDAAEKAGETNDLCAIQAWARKGTQVYLLDRVCERMEYPEYCRAMARMHARWQPWRSCTVGEDAGHFVQWRQAHAAEFGSVIAFIPTRDTPGKDKGKEARARFAVGPAEAGDVWLPDESVALWAEDWLDTICAFPRGVHDDEVDAWSQLHVRWATAVRFDPAAWADFSLAV